MKRSRYSAAMSMCPGASNHSWERKRPVGVPGFLIEGLRSDMDNLVLGLAGNIHVEAEQAAGQGLLLDLVGGQILRRRRGEYRFQIAAGEADLGDIADR